MEDIWKKCNFNRMVERDARTKKGKEWGAQHEGSGQRPFIPERWLQRQGQQDLSKTWIIVVFPQA